MIDPTKFAQSQRTLLVALATRPLSDLLLCESTQAQLIVRKATALAEQAVTVLDHPSRASLWPEAGVRIDKQLATHFENRLALADTLGRA